jgi:uncharacterized iron-regulated membrane protein
MTLRRVLFWAHLTAGVCAGVVILTMSFTGVLLMYERQLIEWSDRAYRASSPGAEALPVETLLVRAAEQRPHQAPTAITLRADRRAPAAIAFGQTTVYQDVYSGELVGEPSTGVRRVMSEARAWHRWLSLDGDGRAVGKAISGWSNLILLFIVLSGMYLWIPRIGWRGVRAVALFRTGLRGKARDFNWHNVIGIWTAVPLAIIVATAAPISFPWANVLVYRIAGEAAPAPPAPATRSNAAPRAERDEVRLKPDATSNGPRAATTDGLNQLWARAEQQVPGWRSINLRLAGLAEGPAVFAIDAGTGGQPQLRSTLSLHRTTGDVVRWEPFAAQSAGRRLRSWTRFTHTGEYYGLAGQTVAGIVSAGAVVLVVTGLSLALRRAAGWRARRAAQDREAPRSEAA